MLTGLIIGTVIGLLLGSFSAALVLSFFVGAREPYV